MPPPTCGTSQSDAEQDRVAFPKLNTGPECKFHTQNRNLQVKLFSKFNNILTTTKKIHFSCRCSEAFLLKQTEHLQVKAEETRLACFQCCCLHCQITLFFSPRCPNWSCIAWDCVSLQAFWALLPREPTNFYNTKLCCGDSLLFQQVQMKAVIR